MRLCIVGLGELGRMVVEDLLARDLGTVVAAVDPAEALVGKRVGELVPGAGDAPVRASVEEVMDTAFDAAVVTTSSDLELVMPTLRTLLDGGRTVLSTCEELAWPWLRHPVFAQELDQRAIRHRGRVLGTGVNPGFLMDALPVAVSTVCRAVTYARVERTQNAAHRRTAFQRKIGATLDQASFAAKVADGSLRHVGLGESLHLLTHQLGLRFDRWEETIEPVVAEHDLDCELGPIPAGHCAGVLQVATARRNDEAVATLLFRAAIDEAEPIDRITLRGDPPLDLRIPGGVHGDIATSAIALNCVRALRAVEPGLHTMASIPLQGCVQKRG